MGVDIHDAFLIEETSIQEDTRCISHVSHLNINGKNYTIDTWYKHPVESIQKTRVMGHKDTHFCVIYCGDSDHYGILNDILDRNMQFNDEGMLKKCEWECPEPPQIDKILLDPTQWN